MRSADLSASVLGGVVIFGALELGSRIQNVRTAITPSVWLDLLSFVLALVLVRFVFGAAFRKGPGSIRAFFAFVVMLLVLPLLAGVIGGALDVTLAGSWGIPTVARSVVTVTPVNVLLAFMIELPFFALPAVIAVTVLLLAVAGRARGRRF